ncbi:hypothetical protein Pelo_9886 [Pelomyxa schiedti]|nr:hypothetical protein Pelo_9886 [Pelomyxa schiedti]
MTATHTLRQRSVFHDTISLPSLFVLQLSSFATPTARFNDFQAPFIKKNPFPRDSAQSIMVEVAWTMTVSRVVWDHVVVPTLVHPSHNRGVPLSMSQCRWLLGIAEALFPLVPRACALLQGERVRGAWSEDDCGTVCTSRYFLLRCAGEVGSKKCIYWILRRKETRNIRKECLAVLKGLCAGGHIEMARELVERSGGVGAAPWSGCRLLSWPVDDSDLIDDIRETSCSESNPHSVLFHACKGGNLEVVKWVMSRFSGVGTELWEVPMPFRAAVRWGNIEVVKWMASSTDVVGACWEILAQHVIGECGEFIASPSLEVMKFCTDLFCGGSPLPVKVKYMIHSHFLSYLASSEDVSLFKEGWKWLKERHRLPPSYSLISSVLVKKPLAFKCAVEDNSITPTQSDLRSICRGNADEDLVQWVITKCTDSVGYITPDTFIVACGNKNDSVSLVRFLLTKMSPHPQPPITPEEQVGCLAKSLYSNNTSIADWLEKTFHVMDQVNAANSSATDEAFRQCCVSVHGDGTGGVQWFLSHCANVTTISKEGVAEAFYYRLERGYSKSALFLLESFAGCSEALHKSRTIAGIFSSCDLLHAHTILHKMEQGHSGPLCMEVILLMASSRFQSGKVVKGLIQHFHLNEEQVKLDSNHLLAVLISSNKTSCTKWFLRTFNVTLNEIVAMTQKHTLRRQITVSMWKMLLQAFPEMTGTTAITHLKSLVCASPLHIKASMQKLGLSLSDM